MKTIETTVYTINELDEKAKQKAREWYLTLDFGDAFGDAFEQMAEDAKNIGLDLNKKAFIVSAIECSEAILREHGENCDTTKQQRHLMTLWTLCRNCLAKTRRNITKSSGAYASP